ncbi:MAG: sigma-70 family RNA polymerase sigma factor [Bacteroidales bacterium]|nr:sigma-70 family RNA polymerase sigma factor [Bacteroidales bacterium]
MELFQQNEKAQRDYKLVLAARENGDEKAYADLMRLYREPVYNMLKKMIRNDSYADDLTMETFGKAFRNLDTYTPQRAFSTWLFSIACNSGIDYIRHQHMEMVALSNISVAGDDGVYEFPLPSNDTNPEEELIGNQRKAYLREVVRQLKPAYRRVVEMRYFEELSYEEIAEQLQIPLGTVKIRLRRARMILSEIIKTQRHCL